MDDYLAFAKDLAYKAGKIIKDNFDTQLAVEIKQDDSPVTEVDKAINQLVIDSVKQAFPEHGVLGEEADASTGNEEYQWLCDPLDGTKPFILGVPASVFMLGLALHGEMQVAVVYEPHFDKLYYAKKGSGAFCNGKPIHVNDQVLDGGDVLMGVTTYKFASGLKAAGAKLEPIPGGGYKSMLIARGNGMATIRDKADFHDVGPASLIIEEAGGRVTGLSGEKLIFNGPIGGVIASNGKDHDRLIAIVKEA